MHLINTEGPSIEPLELADAKIHCRVDTTYDDNLITALIIMARQFVEQYIISSLITQNWSVYYDYKDVKWYSPKNFIRLPMKPVQNITTITTYDDCDNATVFDSSNYRLSTGDNRIVLNNNCYWPDNLRLYDCMEIDFVAGFGSEAANVPLSIVQAMKLLVGQWYENRETISDPMVLRDKAGGDLSFTVTALLSQYRTLII